MGNETTEGTVERATGAASAPPLPTARVVTRHGVSGASHLRRRIYQRHLLAFLLVSGGLLALDLSATPGVQWAHFFVALWALVLILHTAGLKSRGYSFAEMLIPPRQRPVQEAYTVPLDYELVRARQLRDGIANAADALRTQHAARADEALAAADALARAVEAAVAAARTRGGDDVDPDVQAAVGSAVTALDELHRRMLEIEILEEGSPDDLPVEALRDRAEALRRLRP